MDISKDWQIYDHEYEKLCCDIRTKDGKEYMECWPNSGEWFVLNSEENEQIPDSEVTHIRLTHSELWDDQINGR